MTDEMKFIDTDKILKRLREFVKNNYDKPESIEMNPIDLRYLLSNNFFPIEKKRFAFCGEAYTIFGLRIYEDETLNVGEFKILGIPKLKKLQ